MRVILVGADLEENLGVCMINAALDAAGHTVEVVPFNATNELGSIAKRIASANPDLVGLSMQFQHRAHDFLALAKRLRSRGYRGHITCGGEFPTMAWREVLGRSNGVDSVVLHEGEETIVELCAALEANRPLRDIAGLALPSALPFRTTGRPLVHDLDRLPYPRRYRPHTTHLGVPFIPIMGGRGCWGSCSYCSITSFYRDAREHGGGLTLRHRSPVNVAAEMAMLWHASGGTGGIFCFHDDNFLLPREKDSIARVSAIRQSLDEFGVGRAGLVGKCRPDCMTKTLALKLRELGVIRLYIGVENASQHGADDLGRRTQTARVHEALAAARDAGIFACYNLLLFEPDATLDDVSENVRFIREHASHPVNFCRAEPYYGTPLHRTLEERSALSGSYLGFDYRIADDRTELLFRICSAAFRERNFAANGVANRYMGLGYTAKLLEFFYDDPMRRRPALLERAEQLTRAIALENADLLEDAIRIARTADLNDRERIERETANLGLRVAALDAIRHLQIDRLQADFEAFRSSEKPNAPKPRGPNRKLLQAVSGMAFAGALSVWALGAAGCGGESVDPAPSDAGKDASDTFCCDPPPPDTGIDTFVVDPPPPDTGVDSGTDSGADVTDTKPDTFIVDPPPPDTGVDASTLGRLDDPRPSNIDQWQDTTPKRSARTDDLPLFEPPTMALHATRDGARVVVTLAGGPEAISTRWQAEGEIIGDGRAIEWIPSSSEDHLRVAIRSKGGVAVIALRAVEV